MPFRPFKCKPYVVESTKDGFIATEGGATSEGGRETGTVHRHLEGVNKQPLGIQTVKSLRIPFASLPTQGILPTEPVFPPEQAAQVREELQSLLEKGAVVPVTDSQESFYSNLFLVPKKNSQMRPVINLKRLNQ